MTGETFKELQKSLELNNRETSEALGVSERTLYYYRSGVIPAPKTVQRLLECLINKRYLKTATAGGGI